MADRPMTEEERAVAQLYDRLYHRTDIVPHHVGRTLALGIAAVWCLFGLWNFLVSARDIPIPRERALLALGFGPLYQLVDPPGLRGALPIAGRQLPVRIALVLVAGPALAVCVGMSRAGSSERLQRYAQRRRAQRYARAQGRPMPDVAARQLGLGDRSGVPLGQVQRAVIGLPYGADKGHIAVIAPTRSGKGLHLIDTLLRWPGAAVVVDPKREQWTRTAGYRLQYGPVYEVPVVGVDLLRAFDPRDPLDVQELHSHLLRPWQDRERIFAEKSLALFQAARSRVGRRARTRCGCWRRGPNWRPLRRCARRGSTPPPRSTSFSTATRSTAASTASPSRPGAPSRRASARSCRISPPSAATTCRRTGWRAARRSI